MQTSECFLALKQDILGIYCTLFPPCHGVLGNAIPLLSPSFLSYNTGMMTVPFQGRDKD